MKYNYTGNPLNGGVYKITNTTNNRIYVGSTKALRNRCKQHANYLKRNKHHNIFLQRDFGKCGMEAFTFEVLEVVFGGRLTLTTFEQKYLDYYINSGNQCYNLKKKVIQTQGPWSFTPEETKKKLSDKMKGVNNPNYGNRMSEESKEKISKANSGRQRSEETKRKISLAGYGRKHTEETKKKIGAGHRDNKNYSYHKTGKDSPSYGRVASAETRKKIGQASLGRIPSIEARQKMSLAQTGRKHSAETKNKMIEVQSGKVNYCFFDPLGNTFLVTNLSKFCREHNLNCGHMCELAHRKLNKHKGWTLASRNSENKQGI